MDKQESFGQAKILVIEDNIICQRIYLNFLKGSYQVEVVPTANEALVCLDNLRYQFIILDLGLPDRPGEELLPYIRSSPLNKNTPTIVLSAHFSEDTKQRCLALGANQVFTKPISFNLLEEVIVNCCSSFSKR